MSTSIRQINFKLNLVISLLHKRQMKFLWTFSSDRVFRLIINSKKNDLIIAILSRTHLMPKTIAIYSESSVEELAWFAYLFPTIFCIFSYWIHSPAKNITKALCILSCFLKSNLVSHLVLSWSMMNYWEDRNKF